MNYRKVLIYLYFIGSLLLIIIGILNYAILNIISQEIGATSIGNQLYESYTRGIIPISALILCFSGMLGIIGVIKITLKRFEYSRLIFYFTISLSIAGLSLIFLFKLFSIKSLSDLQPYIFPQVLLDVIGLIGILIVYFSFRELKDERFLMDFTPISVFKSFDFSIILMVGSSSYIFILIESVFFLVFLKHQFLDYSFFFWWQILLLSIFFIIILFTIYSKKFRLIVNNLFLILSLVLLFLLYEIHILFTLKTVITVLLIFTLFSNYFLIKAFKIRRNIENKKILLLLVLVLFSLGLASFFLFLTPRKTVIITPNNNPELIFFIDAFEMPTDNATYEICRDYNISFMLTISDLTLNVPAINATIRKALYHKVNLHFNIYAPPANFCNINTAPFYSKVYTDHRNWFEAEGFLDSPYIVSFCVDAEPPKFYIQEVVKFDVIDSINYFLDHVPTREEIENATKSLTEMINLIHADEKEAGIIRIGSYMDELDGDGDIELIQRNIYSLDLTWDYSVTMIYRTERLSSSAGSTAEAVVGSLLSDFFGMGSMDEQDVLPVYNFYHRVAVEQSPTEIQTDVKNQYIFIGNLDPVFNNTHYIQNKEYQQDLDICRHFNEEKVFFYNWRNFIAHYGIAELEVLGKHNQQYAQWTLEYSCLETQVNIIFYLALSLLDKILYFET